MEENVDFYENESSGGCC